MEYRKEVHTMNKIQDFSEKKQVTFDDVLKLIDTVCEDKIRSIISASGGDIPEIARDFYANNFGDIVFYPWSRVGFDEDDPETYCDGLEIEATFFFNADDIDGIKMNGTRLVTIWVTEGGFLEDLKLDGGKLYLKGRSNTYLDISRLKEQYAKNPELFVVSDYIEEGVLAWEQLCIF